MSPFYEARFVRLFPVSLLAFERLHSLLMGGYDPPQASLSVLVECCGIEHPTNEQIQYFLDRADTLSKELSEAQPGDTFSENKSKRTFSTSFREFLSGLDSHDLLLMATGYDYAKAEYLFTRVDREDALRVIKVFTQDTTERQILQLEAVMFGMGGGYSDSSQNGDVVDLTNASFEQMKQAMGLPH
jgi:hypothetical protein